MKISQFLTNVENGFKTDVGIADNAVDSVAGFVDNDVALVPGTATGVAVFNQVKTVLDAVEDMILGGADVPEEVAQGYHDLMALLQTAKPAAPSASS